MRSAPAGGYDFSKKRDYRRKVWATYRDTLKQQRIVIADAHALLMPSLEGDEIDVALNAGFRERNLHVVDKEPAIVATLKRRYRKINTYGVTLRRAVERILSDGIRLSCANFDLCGNVSGGLFKELGQTMSVGHGFAERWTDVVSVPRTPFTGTGAFADVSVVSVNLLRGREQPNIARSFHDDPNYSAQGLRAQEDDADELLAPFGGSLRPSGLSLFDHMRQLPELDRIRLSRLMPVLRCDVDAWESLIKPVCSLRRAESYVSSNGQSMLWSIWMVMSPAYTVQRAHVLNEIRTANGLHPYGPEMYR